MEIIIYGSQYGTTREYAQELSKRTGIMAEDYKNIQDIDKYDTIVYFGALYAGSVMGMKKTLNKISNASNKKIIIATVGLADPNDKDNTDSITEKIKNQLSEDIFTQAKIYFLRGGIDYSILSRKHKTMMAFVHRRSKKMKEEEKNAEVRAILETYGKNISYVDFNALDMIIDEIN